MTRRIRVIAPLLLAIGACRAASGHAGDQGPQDQPQRRAGLWDTRLVSGFGGARSDVQVCIDPERDRREAAAAMARGAKSGCPGLGPLTRTADGWRFHQSCPSAPGMRVEYDGVIRGDYNSRYTSTMTERMIPPPAPEVASTTSVTESRWLGPCPAGMAPGDSVVDGRRIPRRRP